MSVVGRKPDHPVRAKFDRCVGFQCVSLEVQLRFRPGFQQAVICQVAFEAGGPAPQGLARGIKVQHRRALRAKTRAARQQLRQIHVVGVKMRLQQVLDPGQADTVSLGRGMQVGAEIDEQIIVDQRRRPFSQAASAKGPRLLAVAAPAEGFGEGVGGRGSKESNLHESTFNKYCLE